MNDVYCPECKLTINQGCCPYCDLVDNNGDLQTTDSNIDVGGEISNGTIQLRQ